MLFCLPSCFHPCTIKMHYQKMLSHSSKHDFFSDLRDERHFDNQCMVWLLWIIPFLFVNVHYLWCEISEKTVQKLWNTFYPKLIWYWEQENSFQPFPQPNPQNVILLVFLCMAFAWISEIGEIQLMFLSYTFKINHNRELNRFWYIINYACWTSSLNSVNEVICVISAT